MLSQKHIFNIRIASVDLDRPCDYIGVFLHDNGLDVCSVPGRPTKVLHELSHTLGVVVGVITIGSVLIYSVQLNIFPFELWLALGQFNSALLGSVAVPIHGGDVLFDLHLSLHAGVSF